MNGILSSRISLQRGSLHPASRVLSHGGIITKGDGVVPLSEIPMVLRLQTHWGEAEGVLYDIEVSGAGQTEVNGLYRYDGLYDGKPSFYHTSVNSRLMWFSGWQPDPVWLLNGPTGPSYITLSNTDLPPDQGWFNVGGGGASPSFTIIPHARRKPRSLYQNTICTIPSVKQGDPVAAWRDEISGSGIVAKQDDPAKRPTLRFREGVPTLQFDGVDDYLIINDNIIGHSGDQTIGAAFTVDDFDSYGGVITSKAIFTDSAPSIEIEPPGAKIAGTFGAKPYKALKVWAGDPSTNRNCSAVVVRTGTTGEFFVDGVSVGTESDITGEGEYASTTYIGTSRIQEVNYFDGDITAIFVTTRTDVARPMAHYLQSIHPS